jgi:hypothetical protein
MKAWGAGVPHRFAHRKSLMPLVGPISDPAKYWPHQGRGARATTANQDFEQQDARV